VLGNRKSVPSRKKPERLSKVSNFKERAKFPSRIKGIDSRKFSRIVNAISEPKIGHVIVKSVYYH